MEWAGLEPFAPRPPQRRRAATRARPTGQPLAQRQVVTLRDVEGLPGGDVCGILGISEGNQRELLHRARARIRRHLEQEAVW
jgi:RNA polymerase sigma-70 factor (ECF subfamily)